MAASTRAPWYLLLSLLAVPVASSAQAGPADDLLPPPVRLAEKRSLGGGDMRYRIARYEGGGSGAAFSPDGKFLIRNAANQGLGLWDVGAGRLLGHLAHPVSYNEGLTVAFSPDSKQLISASWGGHQNAHPVAVWDVAKRLRLRSLDEDVNDTPFTALAVAPDGKTLALAAGHSRRNEALQIVFWDLASGDEVRRLSGLVDATPMRGRAVPLFAALAYSPDGRTLAALIQGRILLVELATGKVRSEITFGLAAPAPPEQQGMTFGALAFSPDGRKLAAGCSDGAVRRFDLRTGRQLSPLSGQNGAIVALNWSPDGKRIRSCSTAGRLVAWRADLGREWQPKGGALSADALDGLWEVLRGDDPRDLFGCQEVLAAAPAQVLPFLRKRLAAVPKVETERIERLIADVQKGNYNTRKRAVIELRKIGAAAAPALLRAQERGVYDELLRRMYFEFANLTPPAEQLRAVRALAVLERVGSAEARKLLKEFSEGSAEAVLTIQAKAALGRLGKTEPAKAEPPGKDGPTADALWKDLAGVDAAGAYRAVRALVNRPTGATLLRDRLKEVLTKDTFDNDPKRVAKLIADLDADDFAAREEASKSLRNLGRLVVPALRKSLVGKVDLEGKRRIDQLLEAAEKSAPAPEMLRVGRALEALELMSGLESRKALEALAKEVKVKWVREAVAESLRRQRLGHG